MSERVRKLRNKSIAAQPSICMERGKIVTESYQTTRGEPQVMRRAIAMRDVLSQMSLVLDEDELIIGNQASRIKAAPLFPEFGIDFLVNEIDSFEKRPYDRFEVDEHTKQVIREIAPFWRGYTHEDRVVRVTRRILSSKDVLSAWDEDKFCLNDVLYNGVRKSSGDGHIIPDYFRLMELGVPGVLKEAQTALSHLDYQKDCTAFEKRLFLDAAVICYKAVTHWFLRYAEEAEKQAKTTQRLGNRESLLKVAANCRSLANGAPKTFREVIQLTYFIHLLLHIESNGHSVSLGRIDQYLYPFYQRDMATGLLSDEEVLELIGCFYIKVSHLNKVRPWSETRYKSGAPMFMTITLGGQTENGADATNQLTYLFLDALAETRLPQPTPIIRVFKDTDRELLTHGVEVLIRHGGGLPAFFSDESIISALTNMGIPLIDARGYAIAGCSEAVIPGKSLSFTGGDCYFNLLKILEIILHEGVNPRTGVSLYPTQKLEKYACIEDIIEEYQRQLSQYMSLVVPLTAITSATDAEFNPTPFASALVNFRIKMGKDISEGGGENAVYSHTILQGHGIADLANSLYVINELVFREKKLPLRKFVEIISNNWGSEEGQRLLNLVRRAYKYGNDIDEVDRFAVKISEMFAQEAAKYVSWRGGRFGVSLQSLTANVPEGEMVGATPDGRVAGEALSDNISPHAGTDTNGPTSTLKSASKIDHSLFVDGNVLNLRFHPSALLSPYGEFDRLRGLRFADMIKTYLVDLKGNQVQFNILSSEELRKAQRHPEQYSDLIVKVAGYSAYFNSLDKRLQDQIIERTEHVF